MKMRTVEQIDWVLKKATENGYSIRYEDLEGRGTATCLIRGQKWLFIDLSQSPNDRWEQLQQTLQHDPWFQALQIR